MQKHESSVKTHNGKVFFHIFSITKLYKYTSRYNRMLQISNTHYNKHPIITQNYESSVTTPNGDLYFHIFTKPKIY